MPVRPPETPYNFALNAVRIDAHDILDHHRNRSERRPAAEIRPHHLIADVNLAGRRLRLRGRIRFPDCVRRICFVCLELMPDGFFREFVGQVGETVFHKRPYAHIDRRQPNTAAPILAFRVEKARIARNGRERNVATELLGVLQMRDQPPRALRRNDTGEKRPERCRRQDFHRLVRRRCGNVVVRTVLIVPVAFVDYSGIFVETLFEHFIPRRFVDDPARKSLLRDGVYPKDRKISCVVVVHLA